MRGQYREPRRGRRRTATSSRALAADVAAIADGARPGHDGPAGRRQAHRRPPARALVRRPGRAGTAARPGGRISSLTLMSSGPGALTGPRAAVLRGIARRAGGPPRPTAWRRRDRAALGRPSWSRPRSRTGSPAEIIDFLRTRMLRSCPIGLRTMAQGPAHLPGPHRRTLAALERRRCWSSTARTTTPGNPPIQDDMASGWAPSGCASPARRTPPRSRRRRPRPASLTRFWNSVGAAGQQPARPR